MLHSTPGGGRRAWYARWWQTFVFLINYDFCPFANRWVLWITRPWVCLTLGCLATFLCALFINSHAYFLLGATSLILGLGVAWPWISIAGLRCRLTFEHQRSREGEASPVRIAITNRWPWPVYGVSLIRGLTDELVSGAGVNMACVAGWSTVEYRWDFRAPYRGLFPAEEAWLETSFPFGLTRAARRVETSSRLLVWPATVPLTALPSGSESDGVDDRRMSLRVGDQGDLLGTRGFRQGDSLRRVHWAQTARQQRMIVCERQAPQRLAVRVLLDLDPHVHDGRGPQCSWEQAIRITASLLESFQRMNSQLQCMVGDRHFVIGAAPADLRRVLDALAQLSTRDAATLPARGSTPVPTAGRVGSGREIWVTTPQRLASLAEVPSDSMESGRQGAAGSFLPPRNVLVLAVSNGAVEVNRLSRQVESPHEPGLPGRYRAVPASSATLTEQLPRAWRSLCHAGR